jgi:hypothetical protein
MNEVPMNTDDTTRSKRLEQRMQSLCQTQASLSAPSSLQSRVLATIERRAREWWRQPLMQWPVWAQALSLMICIVCAWQASFEMRPLSDQSDTSWLSWPDIALTVTANVFHVLHDLLWVVVDVLPVSWLLVVLLSMASTVLMLWAGTAGLFRLANR